MNAISAYKSTRKGLAMSWFEFPHTRTYDSDLGWIIANMKQNIDAIKWLQRYAEAHQPEYEELKAKVDALVNGLVDVIEPWDSSVEYPIYSIVSYQGQNYIAIRQVPVGAMITNEYYWQPANTVVEQINAIGHTVTEMQERIYTLIPDDFEGTDTEKLQQCLDVFTGKPGGTIVINRPYTIDADLIVRHRSFYGANNRVTIIGQGKTAAINMQTFSFKGDSEEGVHNYGNICFMNLNITGTGSLFNMDTLIRVYMINCAVQNFEHVVYTTHYIQSVGITSCSIRDITGTIFEAEGGTDEQAAIDVHLVDSLVEHCEQIIDSYYISMMTVSGCCIEAFHNIPFVLRGYVRQMNIIGNYFESNANGYNTGDTDYNGVTVDMSAINVNSFMNFNFKDNVISQKITDTPIVLPNTSTSYGSIAIMNNGMPRNTPLIKASATLTTPYRNLMIAGNSGTVDDPNELLYMLDKPVQKTIERSAPNVSGTLKVKRINRLVLLTGTVTVTGGPRTYTLVTGDELGNLYYTNTATTDPFPVFDKTHGTMLLASWSAGGSLTVNVPTTDAEIVINTIYVPVIG